MANKVPNIISMRCRSNNGNMKVDFSRALLSLYVNAISSVCDPDLDAMSDSMSRIARMNRDDKKISFGAIQFVAENFAELLFMLASDYKECSKIFYDAFYAELIADTISDQDRFELRAAMSADNALDISGHLIIGVSCFSDNFTDELINTVSISFNTDCVNRYAGLVFTSNPEIVIMLSCPVYLLRMFSFNGVFLEQIKLLMQDFERGL